MIRRCQIKTLLALILCVLVQNYSHGQQSAERYAYSLEELSTMTFITIDRKLTKLDDVMGTVYSISHETIKKRGYQNLKDVLEQIPGFVVFHRDLQFVAGIRGLNSNDNEKITLLINGNEVNGISDPDFLNGEINFDEVERLEIVVGPSSFFQQVNTLAATINIITKQRNGASFTVTSGSDLDHRMSLAYGSAEGSFKFNTMLSLERYKGFDAFDNTESVFDSLEDTKYTGRNDNFWSVTTASYKGWSTQLAILRSSTPYLIADNRNLPGHNYYIDDTYSLVIKKSTTINKSLSTTFTLQASSKKLEKVPDFYLKEYTYHTELGVIWENDIHEIKLGVQYTYKDPSKFIFDSGELVNSNRGIHTLGFYLHDTWQFSEKLKLINGVRIDKSTLLANHQWHVSGTSGLVYQVDDDWVTKLMYNVSTRMPSTLVGANNVWGADNNNPISPSWAVVNDTPDKPETLTTFEF